MASAAMGAEREGAPRPSPSGVEGPAVSDAPRLSDIPPLAKVPRLSGTLLLRMLAPREPGDKGSEFTDAGFGLPDAPPNAIERAKLEVARQALEAARAAGTLFLLPRRTERFDLPADRERAEALKLQLLARRPAKLAPFLEAGVGPFKPLHKAGKPGLTPLEQAKLEAFLRGETFAAPPATEPAKPEAIRDRATQPDGKEER
jgi:hypothetical protein